MDNQDKLYKQFQEASKKTEGRDFPAMEKVWARVEEKLDKKEDRKAIVLWKKLAVAASLLLFFTLGYQLTQSNDAPLAPKAVPQNEIVTTEKTTVIPGNSTAGKKSTVEQQQREAATGEKTEEISTANGSTPNSIVINNPNTAVNKPLEVSSEKTRNSGNPAASVPVPTTPPIATAAVTKTDSLAKNHSVVAMNESKDDTVTNTKILATTAINPITGEKTISGTVIDATGALPGASVVIVGTKKGTLTDLDGKFTVKAKKGDQLQFDFVGYKTQKFTIANNDNLAVLMEGSDNALQEVIVTGYAGGYNRSDERKAKRQEKKEKAQAVPASIAYMNTTSIQDMTSRYKSNSPQYDKLLQGQAPGLYVNSPSGQPGADTKVMIRGIKSTSAGTDPLYVIDGVPIPAQSFTALNADNIESIKILKKEDASSIYGNRGANGVILIKLKKKLSKKELRKLSKSVTIDSTAQVKTANDEDYGSFIENPFETAKSTPLSTFSIDVDNASYTNIRRFINSGQTVPKDAVRVEEMVNFFKYQYPQPTGSHPFSINTEYSGCPWNKNHQLLKIGLQGKNLDEDKLPASNLVFLIDVSGSMSDQNKLPLLVQSLKVLVNQLRKEDRVSLVVYAGAAGMVLPPTAGNEKQLITDALEKLSAGGSTAGGQGIELAYKTAQENFIKGGNNRVILATDGDFNVGGSSNTDMQTLIEEKRKSGVFLTCLGFGMGNYKDSKMEILSDKGNGNYAYIDNIQEANRFLGKEFKGSMFAIAKDVKIQIEFNPKHVQAYRLIGYENRKLQNEDFTNDAIDAGELGSGHTVTALYEIIPTGVKSEFSNNQPELKYTKVEESTAKYNDELATIKFRYKKPDGDKSIEMLQVIPDKTVPLENSTADFKFVTAVAWFGLKLRDSKFITDKSSKAIKELARKGLSNDEDGYKAEFIRLVEAVK